MPVADGIFGIPIPNPSDLIPGLGGGGGGLLGGLFNGLGALIEKGIASAAQSAFDELEKLINSSAGSISFAPASWWATKVNAGAGSIWPTMLSIAVAVLLGCLILAVIQGRVGRRSDGGVARRRPGGAQVDLRDGHDGRVDRRAGDGGGSGVGGGAPERGRQLRGLVRQERHCWGFLRVVRRRRWYWSGHC